MRNRGQSKTQVVRVTARKGPRKWVPCGTLPRSLSNPTRYDSPSKPTNKISTLATFAMDLSLPLIAFSIHFPIQCYSNLLSAARSSVSRILTTVSQALRRGFDSHRPLHNSRCFNCPYTANLAESSLKMDRFGPQMDPTEFNWTPTICRGNRPVVRWLAPWD